MASRQTQESGTSWSPWDRRSLQFILVVLALSTAAILVVGTAGIVSELSSGQRTVTLFVDGPLPPAADSGSASIDQGSFETATFVVSDLSFAVAALLTAGSVIGILIQLAVAASFCFLVLRLLARKPFLKSLSWAFLLSGTALAVGGLFSQVVYGIGAGMLLNELGSPGLDGDFWPLAWSFDLSPIAFGFGLMIVGGAFEYGERLQRDTEGLV